MLASVVKNDVFDNYTDDMPALRYGGPIPLFLYGNTAKYEVFENFLKSLSLKPNLDFVSREPCMETVEEFVGLRSFGMNRPKPYSSYLIDAKEFDGLTAKPVRGRLVTVSLKGLVLLDRFYMNGYRAHRTRINLVKKNYSVYDWAYAYVFDPLGLSKGGKPDSDFGFKPMPVIKLDQKEIFTFS